MLYHTLYKKSTVASHTIHVDCTTSFVRKLLVMKVSSSVSKIHHFFILVEMSKGIQSVCMADGCLTSNQYVRK